MYREGLFKWKAKFTCFGFLEGISGVVYAGVGNQYAEFRA